MAAALAGDAFIDPETGQLTVNIRKERNRPTVGAGEYGMPYMPPLPERAPDELRSGNSPLADLLVAATGQTAAGPAVDTVAKLGRATGDTVSAVTGANLLPWAARKVDALSDSAAHGWGNLADLLKDGVVTTSAEAQDAPDDPLAPMRAQQRVLQKGLENAMEQRRLLDPATKGKRAADPNKREKDPGYWKADDDVAKFSADLEKLNTELRAQADMQDRERERQAVAKKRAEEEAALTADNQRLATARKNKSAWEQVLQNDPELLGALGGGVAGHVVRSGLPFLSHKLPALFGGVKGRADTALAGRNAVADELMTRPAADWPGRIGRVNSFATSPGAQPISLLDSLRGVTQQAPFTPTQATRGHKYTYNPQAPTGAALYPQSTPAGNLAKDIGIGAGIGGTESAITHFWMTEAAEKELAEANKAVKERATEANVQRLMKAEQRVATARAIEYGGRGFALGFGGGGVTHPRNISRPGNVGEYDAEVARIRRYLSGQSGGGPRGGGGRPKAPPGGTPPAGAQGPANTQLGPQPIAPAAPASAPVSHPRPPDLAKDLDWNDTIGQAYYPKGHPKAGKLVPGTRAIGKTSDASDALVDALMNSVA